MHETQDSRTPDPKAGASPTPRTFVFYSGVAAALAVQLLVNDVEAAILAGISVYCGVRAVCDQIDVSGRK
jgi:hypothetical protein